MHGQNHINNTNNYNVQIDTLVICKKMKYVRWLKPSCRLHCNGNLLIADKITKTWLILQCWLCLTGGCLIVPSQKNLKNAFMYCGLFSVPNHHTHTHRDIHTHTHTHTHTQTHRDTRPRSLSCVLFFHRSEPAVHVEIPPGTCMYLCTSFVIVLFWAARRQATGGYQPLSPIRYPYNNSQWSGKQKTWEAKLYSKKWL